MELTKLHVVQEQFEQRMRAWGPVIMGCIEKGMLAPEPLLWVDLAKVAPPQALAPCPELACHVAQKLREADYDVDMSRAHELVVGIYLRAPLASDEIVVAMADEELMDILPAVAAEEEEEDDPVPGAPMPHVGPDDATEEYGPGTGALPAPRGHPVPETHPVPGAHSATEARPLKHKKRQRRRVLSDEAVAVRERVKAFLAWAKDTFSYTLRDVVGLFLNTLFAVTKFSPLTYSQWREFNARGISAAYWLTWMKPYPTVDLLQERFCQWVVCQRCRTATGSVYITQMAAILAERGTPLGTAWQTWNLPLELGQPLATCKLPSETYMAYQVRQGLLETPILSADVHADYQGGPLVMSLKGSLKRLRAELAEPGAEPAAKRAKVTALL